MRIFHYRTSLRAILRPDASILVTFFYTDRFNWLWTTFIPIFRDFPSFVMTIRPVENSLIWSKMVPFFEVFGNYFKNGSNDFDDFFIWCSSYCCSSFKKNRMSGKNLVPELWRPEKSKIRLKTIPFSTRFLEVMRWFPRKWKSSRSVQNSLNYNHAKFQVDLIIIQCPTTGQSWPKS